MAAKKQYTVLTTGLMALQYAASLPTYAQSAPGNLDLSSTDRNVVADHSGSPTSITVGGESRTIATGDLVTAAEYVALTQMMSTGAQSLVLSSDGNAIGGSFLLSGNMAQNLTSLSIPQSVSAIGNFATGSLNVAGNITNSGTFYAISTDAAVSTATISAINIFNNPGALLTSVLPTGGLSGFSDAISNLNLNLVAQNTIFNSGVISSSGALTMQAASIVNALPAGVTGPSPVMQALGNINLVTSQITNAGLINSLTNNINVASLVGQSINFNNAGGRVEALSGLINIRDASVMEKIHLTITGGDLLAQELNLYSGDGLIDIQANNIEGVINAFGGDLKVQASTPNLSFGTIMMTGDPDITNTEGDVVINWGGGTVSTNGAPLHVLAAGSITTTATAIDTAGGEITMQAGSFIDLSRVGLIKSTNAFGSGGRIQLIALGGDVLLSESSTIDAGGYLQISATGNVKAGTINTHGTSVVLSGTNVSTGSINTSGASSGGGVEIRTNSNSTFTIGTPGQGQDFTANGVNGTITTSAGMFSGFLLVQNQGSGGITIARPDDINTSGLTYSGEIALDAGAGSLVINSGTLSSSGGMQSGPIFLTADTIVLNNAVVDASAAGPGSSAGAVFTSSRELNFQGSSQILATGPSGGDIQILASDSLYVDTSFNPGNGNHNFMAYGYMSQNSLSVTGSGTLTADASGDTGGFVQVAAGALSFSGGSVDILANGTDGNGGTIYVDANSVQNTSQGVLLAANGAASGNGGVIQLLVNSGDVVLGSGGSGIEMQAMGGESGGSGGSMIVFAGRNIDVDPGSVVFNPRGADANGGQLSLIAGLSEAGSINFTSSGTISADSNGIGSAGIVKLSALGEGSSLHLTSDSSVSAQGGGGLVILEAGGDIIIDGTDISLDGRGDNNGGLLLLSAGLDGEGTLLINGNLSARGSGTGNGGYIGLSYSTNQTISLGAPGQGNSISVDAAQGQAGSIDLYNMAGDLNATLNMNISAQAADPANAGNLFIDQTGTGGINLQGPGAINANLTARGDFVNISAGGAGTEIGVSSLQSNNGDITVRTAAVDGALVVLDGASVQASGGDITLGARTVVLGNGSSINMDHAGVVRIDSGASANSLTLVLPDGGAASVNITQGDSARPGTLMVGPSGSGSLDVQGGGLIASGATLALNTSGGDVSIASGVSMETDAYDQPLDFAFEIATGQGNINLSGNVSASQVRLSTGGGDIYLNTDITSPDVRLSVTGSGSINQTAGAVGIGSLTLSSESGNIGTEANPLDVNVLELKVNSTSNVYLSNASSVDVKTSDVFGTFSLTAAGDIAMESNVYAHSLELSSTGTISVFASAEGRDGVTASATSGGVTVASGGRLFSSLGNVSLNTSTLTVDGSAEAVSSGTSVVVNGQAVAITGAGSIVVGGSGSSILVNGASIALDGDVSFNVQSGSGVTLAASSVSMGGLGTMQLDVLGGGSLSIATTNFSIENGSSIVMDAASGNGLSVASTGSGLTVAVGSINGAAVQTAGAGVSFSSGAGEALVFTNNGQPVSSDLTVSGGAVSTQSAQGDTVFSGVNLVANQNVTVTVDDGTLSLGGDIESSGNGAVVSLLDPGGITIAGTGNVRFTGGASGTIILAAFGTDDLSLSGTHLFDAGNSGTVSFSSQNAINFTDNSQTTVNAASVSLSSPVVNFGSNSSLSTGNAAILMSSSSGLLVNAPSSGSAVITTTGGLNISAPSGSPITFGTSGAGTLEITGSATTISTSNADVTVAQGVVLQSDHSINISTPGGLFVNNGSIVTPSDVFTLTAAGALLVDRSVTANDVVIMTTANNGTITLGADITAFNSMRISAHGKGNIIQTSGMLRAGDLVLESGSGNIGTKDVPILFTANSVSISTAGKAYVESQGSTTLGNSSVGSLTMSSTQNISVGGNVSGKSLNLKAEGSINGVGQLNAQDLTLKAGGNIGSSSQSLKIDASELTVKNSGGAAFIAEANSVAIDKAQVKKDFNLTAAGNLTVGDVHAKDGSVNLISGGSILVREHGSVKAGEGNILIRSTDSASGTITLAEHADIDAFSHHQGSGNVYIIVGAMPSSLKDGKAPGNVKVSEKWGGNVYFGNGISADGKNNQINAWGSNVVFSTGSRPASAIKLLGNVKITADPPPVETPFHAAPAYDIPSGVTASYAPQVVLPQIGQTLHQMPVYSFDTGNSRVPVRETESDKLIPIAHVSAAVAPLVAISRFESSAFGQLAHTGAVSMIEGSAALKLDNGAILLSPKKDMIVHCGQDTVELKAGSVVLVKKGAATTEIINICESQMNGVRTRLKGHKDVLTVAPGARLSVSSSNADLGTAVATRRSQSHELKDGRFIHLSEISTLSLIEKERLVADLFSSKSQGSRRLSERILKFAACLQVVTASHGAYNE